MQPRCSTGCCCGRCPRSSATASSSSYRPALYTLCPGRRCRAHPGGRSRWCRPRHCGCAAEVAALAEHYGDALALTGAAATAPAVLAGADGARLVHLAAHGCFRADNPLFSCLELADGPLMVYDLEMLRAAPRQLVLSACDSGLSDVRPGGELMGLAA